MQVWKMEPQHVLKDMLKKVMHTAPFQCPFHLAIRLEITGR